MYDAKKIIGGLFIFIALISYPVWSFFASGAAATAPELETPANDKQCVEATDYMKANHGDLLMEWRQSAVREGVRTYLSSDGSVYEISLSSTCLGCHSKEQFCDKCHDYAGVTPDCWNCHVVPEGN